MISTVFVVMMAALVLDLAPADGAAAVPTAISCVVCQHDNPACQDPFNKTIHMNLVRPCDLLKHEDTCYKYFNADGKIQRGCTADGETNDCPPQGVTKSSTSGGVSWCYRCYSLNCNSAHQIGAEAILIFGVFLLVAFATAFRQHF